MAERRTTFLNHRWLFWFALVILFGVGSVIRLYDLQDPPLDFHATRQLHSILMARGMYYESLPEALDWQRVMAVEQWRREGLIEPPIMEHLAAMAYRLAGGEYLWIPRLLSILFWMLGGVGIFFLVRELSDINGAVFGLAYFLLLPYGAIASRAFQPDPLLTTLIIFSWWGLIRWSSKPTWHRLVLAGLLSGAAILVKSTAVFFVGGACVGNILAGPGIKKSVRNIQVWVLGLLVVLPYAIFHFYGVYVSGLLTSQFALRFFPKMWLDPVFYLRWNGEISSVVGFPWFLVAVLATFLAMRKEQRGMVIGIWAGYFLYGMTFPYHITTHDYYQLPLIPLVAIGVSLAASQVLGRLEGAVWFRNLTVVSVLLYAVTIQAWDTRVTLKRNDYRGEPAIWQELGEKLGHQSNFVSLSQDYSMRLEYWGWTLPINYMTSADIDYRALAGQVINKDALFHEQTAGKDFFVVTLFSELDNQPELKTMLETGYPILEKTGEYIIYDLRNPLIPK